MDSRLSLYHGSSEILTGPRFGYGNVHNDYGQGFYCTEYAEIAKEWACRDNCTGFANHYELDCSGLSVLRFDPGNSTLSWLGAVVGNRLVTMEDDASRVAVDFLREQYSVDLSGYDVIIGCRVDDRYYDIVRRFLHNSITLEVLSEVMTLGKKGEQVVLKSERSFDRLTYLDLEPADPSVYYPLYGKRMADADRKLESAIRSKPMLDGRYIIDIIRERRK